jgi:O-antigen/teichoic acid export membrane protein
VTTTVGGRRVFTDWLVSIGAEGVTACANLAAGILLARAVGADGKGVFTVATTIAAIAAAVLGLRWERPAGHFLARDTGTLPIVLSSVGLVAGIAMGLAAFGLAVCPSQLLGLLFRGVEPQVLALVAWLIGAYCLFAGIAAIYGGLRDFAARSRFLLAYNVLQALCVAILYVLGVREVVTYLWWCTTASWLLELVWLAEFARRRRLLPRWDWRLIRRMAAFGSLSYLSLLLDLVTVRLDIILLNAMASTAAAGVYSVAVAVGARLASIPQIVAYVVFHRTSARELGSGARTAQILRLAALALLGGGIVAGILGSVLIVPLYGPEFAAAVPALWVMIPAMGIWGLYRLLASDVEGRGRPGLVSMSSLVATMTIVALDLAWIPQHGILGAAWASLVAYGVALAAAAFMFCRVTGLSFRDAYLYRSDDLGALLRIASRLVRGGRLADQPG